MKSIAVIVLLALATAASTSANDKDVVVKTDKFTGRTSVIMKPVGIGAFTYGLVLVQLGMEASTNPDGRIFLAFTSTAGEWQFLQGADVHVLADGKRIDLGHFEPINGTVLSGGITDETVWKFVGVDVLDEMANAKDLEIEVGRWDCHVKPKNIEHMKHFAETLPAK